MSTTSVHVVLKSVASNQVRRRKRLVPGIPTSLVPLSIRIRTIALKNAGKFYDTSSCLYFHPQQENTFFLKHDEDILWYHISKM